MLETEILSVILISMASPNNSLLTLYIMWMTHMNFYSKSQPVSIIV